MPFALETTDDAIRARCSACGATLEQRVSKASPARGAATAAMDATMRAHEAVCTRGAGERARSPMLTRA